MSNTSGFNTIHYDFTQYYITPEDNESFTNCINQSIGDINVCIKYNNEPSYFTLKYTTVGIFFYDGAVEKFQYDAKNLNFIKVTQKNNPKKDDLINECRKNKNNNFNNVYIYETDYDKIFNICKTTVYDDNHTHIMYFHKDTGKYIVNKKDCMKPLPHVQPIQNVQHVQENVINKKSADKPTSKPISKPISKSTSKPTSKKNTNKP